MGSKHCSVQALGYSNGQNRLKLPALLVSIFWREDNKQMEENQCMIYQESRKRCVEKWNSVLDRVAREDLFGEMPSVSTK